MSTLVAPILIRCDTAANWTTANPILLRGEMGLEIPTAGGAGKCKLGDGINNWTALPYFGGSGSGSVSINGSDNVAVSIVSGVYTIDLTAAAKSSLANADTALQASNIGTGVGKIVKVESDQFISPDIIKYSNYGNLVAGLTGLANDATNKVAFGAATCLAILQQTTANVAAWIGSLFHRGDMLSIVLPYSTTGVAPTVTPNSLFLSDAVVNGLLKVKVDNTTDWETTANGVVRTDDAGEAYGGPLGDFFEDLEAAGPFNPVTLSITSGLIAFDKSAGRRIMLGTPTGNLTFDPSCWSDIIEGQGAVEVTIPMGGTAFTISPGVAGVRGLWTRNLNAGNTYAANLRHKFRLLVEHGACVLEYAGSAVAAGAAAPVFIGKTWAKGDAVASVAGTRIGDRLDVFAYAHASSTQPTLPPGWTNGTVVGDSLSPQVRHAWKIATVNNEGVSGFTGATQIHCVTTRKAGGSPVSGPAPSYTKDTYGDLTANWPAITITQPSLIIAWAACQNADEQSIPAGMTALETGNIGSVPYPNRFYMGISDLVSSNWPAQTTTGVGGAGRRPYGMVTIQ